MPPMMTEADWPYRVATTDLISQEMNDAFHFEFTLLQLGQGPGPGPILEATRKPGLPLRL